MSDKLIIDKLTGKPFLFDLPSPSLLQQFKGGRGGGGGGSSSNNTGTGTGYSPATKVVATESSGFAADYKTNGSNDALQIQAAVNALPSDGGSVYIKGGTYHITTRINLPQKVRIFGDGITTQLNSDGASSIFKFVDGISSGHTIYNAIEQLRFWGNSSNDDAIDCGQYGQEFVIRNCWFHKWGTSSNCVNAGGTNKKFHITGNFFGGSAYDDGSTNKIGTGIRLSATGDVEIFGNNFHQFNVAINGNTEKTQIVGNNIYSSIASLAPNTIGINLGTVSGGLQIANIVGNTISDIDYGIKTGQANLRGLTISGNFFRNINNNAIALRGAHHTIVGNYFQDVARAPTGADDAQGMIFTDGGEYIKVIGNNCYNSHSNMAYFIAPLDTATGKIMMLGNSSVGHTTAVFRKGSFTDLEIGHNFDS